MKSARQCLIKAYSLKTNMNICRQIVRARFKYLGVRLEKYKREEAIVNHTLYFKWHPNLRYRIKARSYMPFETVYSSTH